MKLHFSPLKKKRIKRFFKRPPMDSGLDWEMAAHYQEKPLAGI
jgi:hypothetical protein